jgi:hypothetical protein
MPESFFCRKNINVIQRKRQNIDKKDIIKKWKRKKGRKEKVQTGRERRREKTTNTQRKVNRQS